MPLRIFVCLVLDPLSLSWIALFCNKEQKRGAIPPWILLLMVVLISFWCWLFGFFCWFRIFFFQCQCLMGNALLVSIIFSWVNAWVGRVVFCLDNVGVYGICVLVDKVAWHWQCWMFFFLFWWLWVSFFLCFLFSVPVLAVVFFLLCWFHDMGVYVGLQCVLLTILCCFWREKSLFLNGCIVLAPAWMLHHMNDAVNQTLLHACKLCILDVNCLLVVIWRSTFYLSHFSHTSVHFLFL